MLVFLILLSAIISLYGTWVATAYWGDGGGNPIVSVGVAFFVTLLWARGYRALEQDYFRARFSDVRRRLGLWGRSMGRGETLLTRVFLDVEERNATGVKRGILAAGAYGLEEFTHAWSSAHQALLEGDAERAFEEFIAGARRTEGIDRAELYCEAALLILQRASTKTEGPLWQEYKRAHDLLEPIETLLDESPLGVGGNERLEYVQLLLRLARALLLFGQKRWDPAADALDKVISRSKRVHSLRSRRLGQLARIERLFVLHKTSQKMTLEGELAVLEREIKLPTLRVRLAAVTKLVRPEDTLFVVDQLVHQEPANEQAAPRDNSLDSDIPMQAREEINKQQETEPEEQDGLKINGDQITLEFPPATKQK